MRLVGVRLRSKNKRNLQALYIAPLFKNVKELVKPDDHRSDDGGLKFRGCVAMGGSASGQSRCQREPLQTQNLKAATGQQEINAG